MAGPHMECARKVVIAGDTRHDGVVYMPVLHQAMALHSILLLKHIRYGICRMD